MMSQRIDRRELLYIGPRSFAVNDKACDAVGLKRWNDRTGK